MEKPPKYKIGDQFRLPYSGIYRDVYTVTCVEKLENDYIYWAIINGTEKYSREHRMKEVSKLEKVLK